MDMVCDTGEQLQQFDTCLCYRYYVYCVEIKSRLNLGNSKNILLIFFGTQWHRCSQMTKTLLYLVYFLKI